MDVSVAYDDGRAWGSASGNTAKRTIHIGGDHGFVTIAVRWHEGVQSVAGGGIVTGAKMTLSPIEVVSIAHAVLAAHALPRFETALEFGDKQSS